MLLISKNMTPRAIAVGQPHDDGHRRLGMPPFGATRAALRGGKKNARSTIGSSIQHLSSELTMRTATQFAVRIGSREEEPLAENPARGGMPIIPSAPTAKAPMVHGIGAPMPSSWLISVRCAAVYIEPAAKNSVILLEHAQHASPRLRSISAREWRSAENDVGELRHRRICKPAFQIVLLQRDQGGDHHGRARDRREPARLSHRG